MSMLWASLGRIKEIGTVKRNIVFLHIAFWLVFFAFKFADYSTNIGYSRAATLVVVPNTFNIVAAYIHYFFLLPVLLQSKWPHYFLILLGMLAIIIWTRGYTESIFLGEIFQTNYYNTWTTGRILSMLFGTGSFILFIAMLRFTVDRFVLEGQKKALENEKLNAELNYLKAQINPHFLFNTLHNLNYLTQVKSEQASEVIIKLSNIMRYMIYESNKTYVALGREINYIRDYLDLESIRLNNAFSLKFNIDNIDPETQIAPLLLIPLVENAFKHGVSDRQPDSKIEISLKCDKKSLHFQVVNSLKSNQLAEEAESGFGLRNLKHRLSLSYPGAHSLQIEKTDKEFIADLSLKL
ncbi:MAG: histidine kinase [Ekhidna sp.]|uniref:sensor histidine kinase n=1 Tax=Ekhidna sp. TaxID=2608089 RepID=UPI0032F09CBD